MAKIYSRIPLERLRAIAIDYLAAYTPIREYRHVAGLSVTRSANTAAGLGDSRINTTRNLLQVNP